MPFLPRIHAVELHDLPGCPEVVRETIVESLGNALRWGKIYDAVAPIFAEFCERTSCDTVLDLCSGTGEPVSVLIESLERQGLRPPRFLLSDLYPNHARLRQVAERHPGVVEIVTEPVDATHIPEHLEAAACTVVSAFHHFPPALATSILGAAAARRRPIFVLEPVPRDPRRTTAIVGSLAAAVAANPFVAARNRALKAALTYLVPVLPLATAFDSFVSMLRMYSEAELFELVADLGEALRWEFRRVPIALGGEVTVFFGVPE